MDDQPFNLFKDLDEITKKFLKNARERMEEARNMSRTPSPENKDTDEANLIDLKNRLRSREPFQVDVGKIPDVFEARLARIKQRLATSEEAKTKNSVQPVPPVAVAPKSTGVSQDPTSEAVRPSVQPPSAQSPSVPYDIVNDMAILLGEMTGKNCLMETYAWSDMDKFSGQLRKCWAGLLTSGDVKKAQLCLPLWSKIIQDVSQSASQWSEYAPAWTTWSENCQKECEVLQMWLNPTQEAMLEVPVAYQNKGKTPKSITGVPDKIVSSLQRCADFAQFMEKSIKPFYWKNTPQNHAFVQCWQQLERWSPPSHPQALWKEEALDVYAVLNAKLVLLATKSLSTAPGAQATSNAQAKPKKG